MENKIRQKIFFFKCLVLFCCTLFNSKEGHSQNKRFNCNIFQLILKGIEEQRAKLKVYYSIKDKVYITADSTGMNPRIINNSSTPNRVIDSLIKVSDFLSVTDDSLYYFKSQNLVVDTFAFFTNDCDCLTDGNMFLFENNTASKVNTLKKNMIEVRGISVKNDQLIINIKSPKSKFSVYFYFNLVFNKPVLSKVRSAYAE